MAGNWLHKLARRTSTHIRRERAELSRLCSVDRLHLVAGDGGRDHRTSAALVLAQVLRSGRAATLVAAGAAVGGGAAYCGTYRLAALLTMRLPLTFGRGADGR